MQKPIQFLIYLCFTIFLLACKKEPVVNRVEVDHLKLELAGDLAVNVTFEVRLSGHPVVLETGVIFTENPKPDWYNTRYQNTDPADQILKTMALTGLQANTSYYAKAFVRTDRDTIFSEVQSIKSGSYFKAGAGVTDIDGNAYPTVVIGTQEWMAQNLRTTSFNNGDPIEQIDSVGEWEVTNGPTWFNFEFASVLEEDRGLFYNGYTVLDDRNVCPSGWHVSTIADWTTLIYYLGNDKYVGGKLKSAGSISEGTGAWSYPNAHGTNISGFNALPSGEQLNQSFYGKNDYAFFHMLDESDLQQPNLRIALFYNMGKFEIYGNGDKNGAVLRCVKD